MIPAKKHNISKNKAIILGFAVIVIIISIVAAIMTIFAFSNQNLKASVLISYKADSVNGIVDLSYKTTQMEDYSTIGTTNFNSPNNEAISPSDDIELTASNNYIVFKYSFRNYDECPYSAIISLEDFTESENIVVEYSKDNSSYTKNKHAAVVNGVKEDSLKDEQGKSYEECIYFVKLAISNLAFDAYFDGGFKWLVEQYTGTNYTSFEASDFVMDNGTYAVRYGGGDISVASQGELSGQSVENIWEVPTSLGSLSISSLVRGWSFPINTKVIVSEGINSIKSEALTDENIIEITLTKTVESIEDGSLGAPNLQVLNYDTNLADPEMVMETPPVTNGIYYTTSHPFVGMGVNSESFVVNIGENCTRVASCLFSSGTMSEVYFPNSIKSVGVGAFSLCSRLTAVHVEDINSFAEIEFEDRNSNPLLSAKNLYMDGNLVTDVVLSNITKIGTAAFMGCTSIQTVTLPEGLLSIGTSAFLYCENLTTINIPSSVTRIGEHAFFNCDKLTSATFADPNGWYYASFSDPGIKTAISSSSLTSNAANLLISTYKNSILTKGE